MEEKKYQIFVSSTYKDLIDAREKVFETILKLYHFPVGMEMFSADDDEQWEVIKDTIASSDYYVVIIGHRYGSVTAEGLSYTEKEYHYAKEQNIPILAFIRDRDVATKPHERDDNHNNLEKLNIFIENASKSKMCDFWKNEDELSTKVAIALPKIFRKTPRIGWIRADKGISPEVSEEIAKLSSENRDLRTEKEHLQSLINDKKPDISVTINGGDSLELTFTEKENLKLNFNNNQIDFWIAEYPQPITVDSIKSHLKPYLDLPAEIDKYNQSLPSKEEVDEFNFLREIYFRIKGTSISIQIGVENLGVSKANEIYIDVTFPKEILVMDKYDIKDFEHPESPIPKNPIKVAEEKYKKDQERMLSPLSALGIGRNIFIPSFNSPLHSLHDSIANLNTNKEIKTDLNKEENTITIRIKSLLHTRKINIDEYAVIPVSLGRFEAKVSIVCEEYTEPVEMPIPIIIE
jgi:hypothetical protein